jgi:hypothetical protein
MAVGAVSSLAISSDEVEYRDDQIILNGSVNARHALGQLRAGKAALISSPNKGPQHYTQLQLSDSVEVNLSDGGTLLCHQAEINQESMTGYFRGRLGQQARYSDVRYSPSGAYLPLEIQGDLITTQVTAASAKGPPSHYSLSSLVAQGAVFLRYTHDFSARADRAIYRDSGGGRGEACDQLTGMIYLVPDGKQGICEVLHGRGDRIRAQLIRIDTEREVLFFDRPIGQVFFEEDDGMLDRIDFSAESLFWDDQKHELSLRQDVRLNDLGMGTVRAEEEVRVGITEASGPHQVKWLKAIGPTHLTLEGEREDEVRQLHCFDGIEIDNRQFQVTLRSPRIGGKVPPGQQIRYRDRVGEVQADEASIHYQLVNSELEVEHITIQGNVYIVNHAPFDPNDQTPVLQYAKADRVDFYPQDQLMILTGEGRRVLFFDKLNNIQVSAPAIRMCRDKVTGKDSFQGVGDVRMRLIGQEMESLLTPFDDSRLAPG